MKLIATRPGIVERLGAELRADLVRALGDEGVETATIIGRRPGTASACYMLRLEPEACRVVLKVAERADLTSEFEALGAFAAAAVGLPGVEVVRPLALLGGGRAYLMEHVVGNNLRAAAPGYPIDTRGSLARAIVAGLRCYHETLGEAYGDFHPGNLILCPGGDVAFLDPTTSDAAIAGVAASTPVGPMGPMAADLGLWAYSVAATALRCWRDPRGTLLLGRLTQEIVAQASEALPPEHRSALVDAAFVAARQHLRRLSRSRWVADRAAAIVARPLLAEMERTARRAAAYL